MANITPFYRPEVRSAKVITAAFHQALPERSLWTNAEFDVHYAEHLHSLITTVRLKLLQGEGSPQTGHIEVPEPKTWWDYIKFGLAEGFPRLFGNLSVSMTLVKHQYTYQQYRISPWGEKIPKDQNAIWYYLFPNDRIF